VIKGGTFYKIEGGGNDFVTFLDFNNNFKDTELPDLAKRFCPRGSSIGADGLILARKSSEADIRMVYYNADGSRAGLCGNGLRSLSLLVYRVGLIKKEFTVETDVGIFNIKILGDNRVRNSFLEPVIHNKDLRVETGGKDYEGIHIDVGVPYYCVFLKEGDSLEEIDMDITGRALRHHEVFAAAGSNITFIHTVKPGLIKIRIFERGVEAETLSSGTGAFSSAIASNIRYGYKTPITVESPGGEVHLFFEKAGDTYKDIWLEGRASILYKGEIIDA
jgi:diaminopimelate epimerase